MHLLLSRIYHLNANSSASFVTSPMNTLPSNTSSSEMYLSIGTKVQPIKFLPKRYCVLFKIPQSETVGDSEVGSHVPACWWPESIEILCAKPLLSPAAKLVNLLYRISWIKFSTGRHQMCATRVLPRLGECDDAIEACMWSRETGGTALQAWQSLAVGGFKTFAITCCA